MKVIGTGAKFNPSSFKGVRAQEHLFSPALMNRFTGVLLDDDFDKIELGAEEHFDIFSF